MNKKILTFTYIMMCISALVALFMVTMVVVSIFVIQALPTIIIFTILTCPAVMLTLHYVRCIKLLKKASTTNEILLTKFKNTNSGLSALFGIVAVSTLIVALFPVIFYGWKVLREETSLFFFIYFLATCIFSSLFTANLALVNREIDKSVGDLHQTTTKMNMTTILQHYKFESKPELVNIIDESVTFVMLKKILHYNCTDIFTNHQSFVICYSNAPYPIWIWCKHPYNTNDIQTIADVLKVEFWDKGDYRFIISEDLLQEIAKIHNVFAKIRQKMSLFSYELRQINTINYKCDGHMRRPKPTEIDTLAMHYHNASIEMEGHDFSMEDCKNIVAGYIKNDELFVWVDDNDQIIATANKILDGDYAKIAFVYTLPTHRRRGYAINLVHKVSQILLDDGLIPILYTNGGYVASNECYKKIGYVQVGKLVDVEKAK